jgi:predicted nuclease of predicted toxin-antitoxin system
VKLLANENFPLPSVTELKRQGHDIASITLLAPGMADEDVLALAHRENRILLTFDRDYGMLVYQNRMPAPPAILYLRFRPHSPLEPAAVVAPILNLGLIAIRGSFFVVERDSFRRRALPSS